MKKTQNAKRNELSTFLIILQILETISFTVNSLLPYLRLTVTLFLIFTAIDSIFGRFTPIG